MIYNGVTPLVKTILLSVCGIMLISYNMIEMTLPLIPPSTLRSEMETKQGNVVGIFSQKFYLYCTKHLAEKS